MEPRRLTFALVRELCLPKLSPEKESKVSSFEEETSEFLNVMVARLDWQGIERIENLEVLTNLKDLYLQHNRISVLENLEFHPRLEYLALGSNQIETIENLNHLSKLRYLDLSHNNISRVNAKELPISLAFLDLRGNPVQPFEYRDKVVEKLPNLKVLDGKTLEEDEDSSSGEESDAALSDGNNGNTHDKIQNESNIEQLADGVVDPEVEVDKRSSHIEGSAQNLEGPRDQKAKGEDMDTESRRRKGSNQDGHGLLPTIKSKGGEPIPNAILEQRLLDMSQDHCTAILSRLERLRTNIIKRSKSRMDKDKDLFSERVAYTQENTAVEGELTKERECHVDGAVVEGEFKESS